MSKVIHAIGFALASIDIGISIPDSDELVAILRYLGVGPRDRHYHLFSSALVNEENRDKFLKKKNACSTF